VLSSVTAPFAAPGDKYQRPGTDTPEVMDQEKRLWAAGWDFDSAEIITEKVADGLHVSFGFDGRI
jgi:hypothetical protein